MIYVGLDVHKRFSRMGCFDPATGVDTPSYRDHYTWIGRGCGAGASGRLGC